MLLPLYHFSICAKTIHTAGDAVAVVSDPQSGVLIHLAAAGVEEVVVLTDLAHHLCNAVSAQERSL